MLTAMRAIWSGSITFGLVNVPVKAYSTTTDHDVSFHQVHDADGGRIRYQRRCEVCGKKIDYEHIDKAYDDGDQTVVIHEEDFEALPEATNDEIEVVQFVPSDQVDPVTLEKSYFLEPQGKSPKSYLLLREALESMGLGNLDESQVAAMRSQIEMLMGGGAGDGDGAKVDGGERRLEAAALQARGAVLLAGGRAEAALPSGRAAVERQHARGKHTARERVELLLDPGSFVEFDALAVHRTTAFGMDRKKPVGRMSASRSMTAPVCRSICGW